jgi:hypothetical protein
LFAVASDGALEDEPGANVAKVPWKSSVLALALLLPLSPEAAHAATDADFDEIRAQIRELKASYEARIQSLEQRLKDAETAAKERSSAAVPSTSAADTVQAAAPPTAPAGSSFPASGGSPGSPTTEAAAVTAPSSSGGGISAFNPAISAVLQGRYANLSRDPNTFAISGFAPGGDTGPGRRGFSVSESEIAMSASVDHLFAANLIVALTPENTVSVEEAYGLVTAAPYGLAPKFGRFFSGLGYMNEQHQHAWDFIDAPLAYQAFLGGQYASDGLQVKWIAPTDTFVELGAEVGNGDNFPGSARNKNGIGSAVVYAHAGDDIGASQSWRAGLSYLQTRAGDRSYSQTDAFGRDAELAFSGTSHVAVADFVWKYAPNGNAMTTNFKLQGEYFWRRERGDLTYDADGHLGLTQTGGYASTQSGWYLQGVYQFQPGWRVGARYDRLDGGSVDYGDNAARLGTAAYDPRRVTVMVDYTPSEFSRIRLQLAQDKSRQDATDNQLFLQYILTIGAHGAHKF